MTYKKNIFIIGIVFISFLLTLFLTACGGNVTEKSFHVDDSDVQKEVEFGETFPLKGLKVTVKLSDGSIRTLSQGEGGYKAHTGGYNPESPGEYVFTISYKEEQFESYQFTITVLPEEIIDESVNPDVYLEDIAIRENTVKRIFLFEEEFSADGIVVEKVYSDGHKEVLPASQYDLDAGAYDSGISGEYTIDIYYSPEEDELFYTSYSVAVTPPEQPPGVESIAILTNYVQKEFEVGEDFNYDNLEVLRFIEIDGVLQSQSVDPSEIRIEFQANYDKNTPGEYYVFVAVENLRVPYLINIKDHVVDIRIESGKRVFELDEEFNAETLRVYIEMASEEEKHLSSSEYSLDYSDYDAGTAGTYTITVTYLEDDSFFITYEVEVIDFSNI